MGMTGVGLFLVSGTYVVLFFGCLNDWPNGLFVDNVKLLHCAVLAVVPS